MNDLLEAIAGHALIRPRAMALSDGEVAVAFAEIIREIRSLAKLLEATCGGYGAIATCMANSASAAVLDLALLNLPNPHVALPDFFTEQQQRMALERAGVSFLISDRQIVGHNFQENIFVLGRSFYVHRLQGLERRWHKGTAKITFTSGSTAEPKGVCLSQSAIAQLSHSLVEAIGVDYAGVHCAVLPLSILLENVAGLYTTLLAGGCYYIPSPDRLGLKNPFAPNFEKLVQELASSRATSAILVPELLRGLMAQLAKNGSSLPEMKFLAVGGAKLGETLLLQAKELSLPLYQGYGLSEAASVVALNTPLKNRPGSVGKALAHISLSLAEDGEILIGNSGFLGYLGDAPAPETLSTGDIGRIDQDGFVHISGRKSSVIITSFGRNVSPEWAESALTAQPEIGQALAFGEAMPALGALIVPSSPSIPDFELNRAVNVANATLPNYARVQRWIKTTPFTLANELITPNGRLRRNKILAAYQSEIRRCFVQPEPSFSFFNHLLATTELERRYLMATPQIRDGLSGKITLDTYLQYLAEAYHHVKHTVPLLTLVHEKLPSSKAWMKEYLDSYIIEESGHENWILDDIRHAGGDVGIVRHGAPRLETDLMVAYAYDFIHRKNPVGFFGMVFVLEGTSTQLATRGAEALMQALKLPENCFRYLTTHGDLDLEHMNFFQSLMNQITDPDDQAAIIQMSKAIYILFANMFRAIPHKDAMIHAA